MSVFMMGLPIGIALSYLVSSQVAAKYGWRPAFFVAGIPGLLCALAAPFLREPARGASEIHAAVGREDAMARLISWCSRRRRCSG